MTTDDLVTHRCSSVSSAAIFGERVDRRRPVGDELVAAVVAGVDVDADALVRSCSSRAALSSSRWVTCCSPTSAN